MVDMFSVIFVVGMLLFFALLIGGGLIYYQKKAEEEKEFQAYYDYIMRHGTEEQKQTAILLSIKKDLQGIKALAGLDLLID